MTKTSRVTEILQTCINQIKNARTTTLNGIVTDVHDYSVDPEVEEDVEVGTVFVCLKSFKKNEEDIPNNFADLVSIEIQYYAEQYKDASVALNQILNVLYFENNLLDTDSTGDYEWELTGFSTENLPIYTLTLEDIRTRNYRYNERVYDE